jgi:hypothetical protein
MDERIVVSALKESLRIWLWRNTILTAEMEATKKRKDKNKENTNESNTDQTTKMYLKKI